MLQIFPSTASIRLKLFASGHRSLTSRSAKIRGMKEGEWCLTFVGSRRKLL